MGKRRQAPTFLLELPLLVTEGQAKHLRAHLEAGRQFYNAVLSEGQRRMRQMRADPAWKAARAIPRSRKPERAAAFSRLREQYGFSEYALHQTATALRTSWIAEHLDAVLAQTLATRAYHALNRVCVGGKPAVCASRAGGVASPASRTSAKIRDAASSCSRRRRATRSDGGGLWSTSWGAARILALDGSALSPDKKISRTGNLPDLALDHLAVPGAPGPA
jgi:hypothetical protein